MAAIPRLPPVKKSSAERRQLLMSPRLSIPQPQQRAAHCSTRETPAVVKTTPGCPKGALKEGAQLLSSFSAVHWCKLTILAMLSCSPNTRFNSLPLNQLTAYVFWATARDSPPILKSKRKCLKCSRQSYKVLGKSKGRISEKSGCVQAEGVHISIYRATEIKDSETELQ